MDNCIFCQIIEGKIPSYKVYEDDQVYAFLDISQTTKGHTLLVPKEHVEDIFSYDADLASRVLSRLPQVAKALDKAFSDMEGLNIINNNREAAYQTVFHSHWHLIPRYHAEDGLKIKFTNRMGQIESDQMAKWAGQIAQYVEVVDHGEV